MTRSRGAPYHLLIGSAWKSLDNVAPGVPITPARSTSLFSTLGNTIYARVGPVAKRVWGFTFEWEDPEATRWLDFAAANPDTEAWLLDGNLAQINMLDPRQTTGTSATLIDVDGLAMPAFVKGAVKLPATALVRAGYQYHLSYTTTRAAGSVVGSYGLNGSLRDFVAPLGSGARRGSFSFTPDSDQVFRLGWEISHVTTAARLTEGSVDDLGFLESRGATPCQVLVGDGAATYKMAWQDRLSLADSSYVLTEVG